MKTIIANALLFFAPGFLPQQAVIAIEPAPTAERALHREQVWKQPVDGNAICCGRGINRLIDVALATHECVTRRDPFSCTRAG